MTQFWFLLLKEEQWNIWINFSKNTEKLYLKIKENILNAQG